MKNFYIFFSLFIFSMQLFSQTGTTDQSIIEKARKIHKKVITIDTHIDINVKNFTDQYNYTKDLHTPDNESLYEFPCDFELKAMGRNSEAFVDTVFEITQKLYCL